MKKAVRTIICPVTRERRFHLDKKPENRRKNQWSRSFDVNARYLFRVNYRGRWPMVDINYYGWPVRNRLCWQLGRACVALTCCSDVHYAEQVSIRSSSSSPCRVSLRFPLYMAHNPLGAIVLCKWRNANLTATLRLQVYNYNWVVRKICSIVGFTFIKKGGKFRNQEIA